MSTFITIVGTVLFTLLVLAFGIWVAWKLFMRKINKQVALAGKMAGIMPRIQLSATKEPFTNEQKMQSLIRELETLGYRQIGKYDVAPLYGTQIAALHHVQHNLCAVVCEMSGGLTWFEVVNIGQDVTNYIFATSAKVHNPANHPSTTRVYQNVTITPAIATDWVLAHRGEGPWRTLNAETFSHEFERAYARTLDHQLKRGGPNANDVRLAAQQLGDKTVYTEEQIARTVEIQAEQYRYALEQACLDNFLQSSEIPGRDWERLRDNTIVIHERLSVDQTVELVGNRVDIDTATLQQDFSKLGSTKPADIFTRVASTAGLTKRLKFLGSVSEPVAARIYALDVTA
jgi:hypothetical protein